MKKALIIADAYAAVYNEGLIDKIKQKVDLYDRPYKSGEIMQNLGVLSDCEIMFSTWGIPKIDRDFLRHAPNLKLVLYGAGSVKHFVTDASWDAGVRVCSAWVANDIPVAEYTLANILFGLKRGLQNARTYTESRGQQRTSMSPAGCYHSNVGIISTGAIGRMVISLLKNFEVNIKAYDPYLTEERAKELGVEKTTLEDVFACCDVVSLHTPLLAETRGMITGKHIDSMKQGAMLINTARGAIIREDEMIRSLKERDDLFAVLDVTDPEPPAPDSQLWDMKNILLTPHIAGSMGNECYRNGLYMYEECCRYLDDLPMKWELTREMVKIMA
ncbi:MAG: hydroxyacid dehydrogenase [Oscillospiraceae bacterium]|nr:hydroxyacid dehydrogenase [Oscillospiraceae bacterium]